MDKLLKYKTLVKEVLASYARQGAVEPDSKEHLETQLLFDDTNLHYQVLRIGWQGIQNTFSVIFHIDIKDGKIWVQRNISDYDIIGDLEAKGIPKEDIVLAFYSPKMRPYTGYAEA
ncbi:MAG TPA: XisI protein [Bacteroidetes bacterium]|nr:XisI protein [Bacteroidota bacterium]